MAKGIDHFSLSQLPLNWKVFITLFLVLAGTGYLFTTLQVSLKTGLGYSNIVSHYSSNPQEQESAHEDREEFDPFSGEIVEPVTLEKLVHNRHIHVLIQSLLFLPLGILILLTTLPEKTKNILFALPFIAILLESIGMFLTRYLADQFAGLILISGILMGISFGLIFILSLYELWIKSIDNTQ